MEDRTQERMNRRRFLGAAGAVAALPTAATGLLSLGERPSDDKARLLANADPEAIRTVKEILAETGIWWDIESLAANVDYSEGDVRIAVTGLLRGRGMNVGESLVVSWDREYGKFYRMSGVELEV